jgi:hypothetical protein
VDAAAATTPDLLATRAYRTFWDWFQAQRCRDDVVGALAREVWRDEDRRDRNFTAQSLANFLRDTWGHSDELDAALVTHAKASDEYEAYLRHRSLERVWFVYRQLPKDQQTAAVLAAICTEESQIPHILHACRVADPKADYALVPFSREVHRCRTCRREWWDVLSFTRCCRPEWDAISAFPDRPLPPNYDKETGIVIDPAGWRWVWVPRP